MLWAAAMSNSGGPADVPPFPSGYRASGVLLHVTSLPSPYGIGDLGSAAFTWIDQLHSAGQRWWQVLPLGPTGYGNSPYQSMSSFAASPALVSPDSLLGDGLLKPGDCEAQFPSDAVDYDAVIPFKHRLLETAWAKGVGLIGDLPFFVSPDSSDVWADPELFLLDERRHPRFVAGVPPDYFSADGQLWGNPVYNWDALRATGYRWSMDRVRALLAHVDLIRLDHFRGFAAAWHVPAVAPTAQSGQWVPGPGAAFFEAAQKELGSLPFIAEDLGLITPDVHGLRDQFQLPGTRVLQFAFDGHSDNPYLPHNFVTNTVAYTGTHDNAPTREWYEQLPEYQRQNFWSYLNRAPDAGEDASPSLVNLAWSSSAALAIAPLQDLLNLGAESRMNIPGRAAGNWRWRSPGNMASNSSFRWLRDLTEMSERVEPARVDQPTKAGPSIISSAIVSQV